MVPPDIEIPVEWFEGMSREIFFLTKGHPNCIANLILSYLAEKYFAVSVEDVTHNRQELFQTHVEPILNTEILAEVDESLHQMLLTISVLRGVNLSILGYLKEHALIVPDAPTPDWAKEFLATLRRVRLVTLPTEKNPLLYTLTPLIRQLLALQLEFREQQRYWEIHTLAARMYDEWIVGKDETGHPLPVRLTDSMQASAIVEGLYHHAQLLARAPEPTGVEQLIARLQDEYLVRAYSGYDIR